MKKIIFLCIFLLLAGCSKTTETSKTVSELGVSLELPEMNIKKKKKSEEIKNPNPLTGLAMNEELKNMRPWAVVFNNLKDALPQSGISQGEVFYEVLSESGITRIIAVSQNYTSEKIGPIRSTRHYFVDFALDNDALFIHHGGSPKGYSFIQNNSINNLDGMALEGSAFYRDWDRANKRGLEHSSYASSIKIKEAVERYGYRKEHENNFKPMFNFFSENSELLDGKDANEIIVPYSDYQVGIFKYDPENEIYYRFQGEEKHIDEENNEQLSVKNIIVQFANMRVIDGEGRRDVDLIGTGTGFMFSNGKYIPIKWEKKNDFFPTQWYDENNELLSVNRGKTWICVFNAENEIDIK